MSQDHAAARPAQTHRLAAFSAVAGILLLLAGLFPPWIIRIDYFAHVGCPSSPQCPPPDTDASSFWRAVTGSGHSPFTLSWAILLLVGLVVGLGPLLALILAQAAIARGAWRGRPPRTLLKFGVLANLVAVVIFLLASFWSYCYFFCNPAQGFPIPGELYSPAGLLAHPGVRYVAPGFWLMLSGLLLALATDLTLLVGARRSPGRLN
jgi:hypothetical protein